MLDYFIIASATILVSLLLIDYLFKKVEARKYLKILGLIAVLLISTCSISACSTQNSSQTKSSDNSVGESQVNGQVKIHYINVGQGDSILVQQNSSNMLIDTGTNASTTSLIAYLKSQNIKKLDYLVLTHPHEDHIGGADAVINNFDIGTVYMPKVTANTTTFKDVVTAMNNKGLKAKQPIVGENFKLGEANCIILGPINTVSGDMNTYSIVIKLTYGNNKFLFTGDAQSSNEEDMIDKGFDLTADVLKVGHHGSETSTSDAFLSKVNPKYAVISCGQGNDYGHPHKTTMDKLQSKGIGVYRTDECGTIVCTSDGNKISFNVNPGDYKYGSKGGSSSSSKASSAAVTSQQVASAGTSKSAQSQSDIVYITNSGKKYHTANCSSLSKSKIAISLEDAKKEGYTPCSKCNPPQ